MSRFVLVNIDRDQQREKREQSTTQRSDGQHEPLGIRSMTEKVEGNRTRGRHQVE